MNQSNVVQKIFTPFDQQKNEFGHKRRPSWTMYFRRRLFMTKILMGHSINEAGTLVGYSAHELNMVMEIPEVKKIIVDQQLSTDSPKISPLVELFEKGKASMADIITLDQYGNIVLLDKNSISPYAWSMVKRIEFRRGKMVSVSMKNGSKYLFKLYKLLHRIQR